MSNKHLTLCDFCGKEMETYNGVRLTLVERPLSGSKERVYPHHNSVTLDYCGHCFEPIACEMKIMAAEKEAATERKP